MNDVLFCIFDFVETSCVFNILLVCKKWHIIGEKFFTIKRMNDKRKQRLINLKNFIESLPKNDYCYREGWAEDNLKECEYCALCGIELFFPILFMYKGTYTYKDMREYTNMYDVMCIKCSKKQKYNKYFRRLYERSNYYRDIRVIEIDDNKINKKNVIEEENVMRII